jgi:hypothetical protein
VEEQTTIKPTLVGLVFVAAVEVAVLEVQRLLRVTVAQL